MHWPRGTATTVPGEIIVRRSENIILEGPFVLVKTRGGARQPTPTRPSAPTFWRGPWNVRGGGNFGIVARVAYACLMSVSLPLSSYRSRRESVLVIRGISSSRAVGRPRRLEGSKDGTSYLAMLSPCASRCRRCGARTGSSLHRTETCTL